MAQLNRSPVLHITKDISLACYFRALSLKQANMSSLMSVCSLLSAVQFIMLSGQMKYYFYSQVPSSLSKSILGTDGTSCFSSPPPLLWFYLES